MFLGQRGYTCLDCGIHAMAKANALKHNCEKYKKKWTSWRDVETQRGYHHQIMNFNSRNEK